MKKSPQAMNKPLQISIGAGSIALLWILNYSVSSHYVSFANGLFIALLPLITLLLCIIGKVKNMQGLSVSAFVVLLFPLVGLALQDLFSGDGSVLSWIYGFTVGALLFPLTSAVSDVFTLLRVCDFLETVLYIILFSACIITSLVLIILTCVQNKKNKEQSETSNAEKGPAPPPLKK